MLDRVPVNPGRVLVTPENGGAAYYATLTRADNPTQEGTPLNKASLLKDATAALFGLGANAVPDDVLGVLSRFQRGLGNEYVWAKGTGKDQYTIGDEIQKTTSLRVPYNTQVYYSSRYTYNEQTGAYELENPSMGYIGDEYSITPTIVQVTTYFKLTDTKESAIYRGGASGFSSDGSTVTLFQTLMISRDVNLIPAGTLIEYVNSPSPNAYPIDDGYTYTALGQLGAKVRIATGSYNGTGTYGQGNETSLTFDFVPRFVYVVSTRNDVSPTSRLEYIYGMNGQNYYGSNNAGIVFSISENTLSWYDTHSANGQYNGSGFVYLFLAIG